MIELTESILKAIDECKGQPFRLFDPRTKKEYWLVDAALFEHLWELDDGLNRIDMGKLVAEAMREDDENDPTLESYQEYKATP
jgi:hypothetical protein